MCGLVDFQALNTSATRLIGLSLVGIATYVVRSAVRLWQRQKTTPAEQEVAAGAPRRIALADNR